MGREKEKSDLLEDCLHQMAKQSVGAPVKAAFFESVDQDGRPTIELVDDNNLKATPYLLFTSRSSTGKYWHASSSPMSGSFQMLKLILSDYDAFLKTILDSGREPTPKEASNYLVQKLNEAVNHFKKD